MIFPGNPVQSLCRVAIISVVSSASMKFEILIICCWFAFLPTQQRLLNFLIQKVWLTPFAARKVTHLAIGFWVIPLAFFVNRLYLVAIPITMILGANVHANMHRGSLGRLEKRIFPLVGFLLPLVLILVFWSQERRDVVVLAVLAMTIGDTAAAIIGRRFGKHRVRWTGKTLEGALANFVASLLVLVLFGQQLYHLPFGIFLLPAAAVALLEMILPGEWDNPVSIVLLMVMLRYPLLS